MRTERRLTPRWLAGALVVLGLFAMHGLTATTASAAAHCGGVPAHAASADHHAPPTERTAFDIAGEALAPESVTTMGVGVAGVEAGHAGALCVAILIAGLVLAALMRRERIPVPVRIRGRANGRPSRGVRAPPDRAELSVWRN